MDTKKKKKKKLEEGPSTIIAFLKAADSMWFSLLWFLSPLSQEFVFIPPVLVWIPVCNVTFLSSNIEMKSIPPFF